MRITFFSAAILAALFAPQALAGPAVATRYTETARLKPATITQAMCLARAETAITQTGFGKIERTEQSRYGSTDDYTAAIRCIIDKDIVILTVAGPSRQIADQGAAQLFRAFEAAR